MGDKGPLRVNLIPCDLVNMCVSLCWILCGCLPYPHLSDVSRLMTALEEADVVFHRLRDSPTKVDTTVPRNEDR